MANTTVVYTGDGVVTNFTVPFPFITRDHVKVYVNLQEVLSPTWWTWVSDSQISFRVAPASGDAVRISRVTPGDNRLVNFQNGAVLTEADLDLSANQNFYLAQEALENYAALVNGELIRIGSSAGVVEVEPDAIIAGLVEKMLEDANAANLQARVTDIDSNAEAIIDLQNGLQVQINTLAQGIAAVVYIQATEPVPGVGGVPDPIPDGSRWYDSDDNNKPYIYDSGTLSWVSIEDPRIGNADVYINYLQTEYGSAASAFVNEVTSISNEAGASTTALNLLGAVDGGNTAFILDLDTTKVGPTESLSERFTQITSDVGVNEAAITAEVIARSDETSALAADISLIGAKNGAGTAFILDSSTVKVDSDVGETVADKFSTVAANDIAVTEHASAIGDLEGRYGVTITNGTYVSGFSVNNSGVSSEFAILADKFAIVQPGTFAQKIYWNGSKLQIDGDLIVTGSINGGQALSTTLADRLSANHLNVTTLSAISADLGTVTAGTLTMNSGGHIKSGATGYEAGSGFWLGYSGGSKFYIGNKAAGQYLSYDSVNGLTVQGDIFLGEYEASDSVLMSANTERSDLDVLTPILAKEFTVDRAGTVRVKCDVKTSGGSPVVFPAWSVEVDGVLEGSSTILSSAYTTQDIDVPVSVGSTVEVFLRGGQPSVTGYLKNARICATVVIPADGGTVVYN